MKSKATPIVGPSNAAAVDITIDFTSMTKLHNVRQYTPRVGSGDYSSERLSFRATLSSRLPLAHSVSRASRLVTR